jgi:hypothetical protein
MIYYTAKGGKLSLGFDSNIPFVIMDNTNNNALVISPFSSFMSVNNSRWIASDGTPV